jgi:hypothetical protein
MAIVAKSTVNRGSEAMERALIPSPVIEMISVPD